MRELLRRSLRLILTCLTLCVLALGVSACDDDSAGPERGVSVEDVVAADGGRLIGDTVTVSGRVEQVVGPRALYLRGSERVLLVVDAPASGADGITEGAVVEVAGVVRSVAAADDHAVPIDPDGPGFVDYEAPTYLVAASIRPLPR